MFDIHVELWAFSHPVPEHLFSSCRNWIITCDRIKKHFILLSLARLLCLFLRCSEGSGWRELFPAVCREELEPQRNSSRPVSVWKRFHAVDDSSLFVSGRWIHPHRAAARLFYFLKYPLFEKSNVSNYQALIWTAPKCQGPDANSCIAYFLRLGLRI